MQYWAQIRAPFGTESRALRSKSSKSQSGRVTHARLRGLRVEAIVAESEEKVEEHVHRYRAEQASFGSNLVHEQIARVLATFFS
jgi:hypothetical protein